MIQRLSTALQILIFLPLTLATISSQAFLLLSLLLTIHSLIHGTMCLLWGFHALSFLQVPVHSFLLLVCFNIFSSSPNPYLITATEWWGTLLTLSGPLFITMEGLSSLLVFQKLGHEGKRLVGRGEVYQFGLLIATAVAYVASAWWIVNVRGCLDLCSSFFVQFSFILVISNSSILTAVVDTAWGCNNCFLVLDAHRIRSTAHKHHREFRPCGFHCL